MFQIDLGLVNPAYEDEVEDEDEVTNVGEYQDGSDVCLVFRVLARFCDGQYAKLQVSRGLLDVYGTMQCSGHDECMLYLIQRMYRCRQSNILPFRSWMNL